MEEKLEHVGVLGMHWGHRKGSSGGTGSGKPKKLTRVQMLRKDAFPKKWGTGKKVAVSIGIASGVLLTPWPIGLGISIASSAYFSNRARTQLEARKALAKIGDKKAKEAIRKKDPIYL